ncbi:hypothetical protein L202_04257 [Cryptococcus amylolentus CBS 6039]|uniref:Ndc10 domain-containing protein n=1 Tax=Cryptococcus amylolentus CBS 6039 TaxID=1295533 RepID=A0A1E3HRB6_9TREE|nr:hypothetical protein L202_04257 [Cryptococcus amylolentus CBS 6039]ODN78675.1 hypothetical protein L202_04257 [Cryptococcus amylolentus CBS 6039]
MQTTYQSKFPRGALQALAGFDPHNRGAYRIVRDYDVPVSLVNQAFPWLNEAEKQLDDAAETDKAGRALVKAMRFLAKVVVQDAPFLRKLTPQHFVWKHELFSDPVYLDYEAKALAEAETSQFSVSDELQRAIPELSDVMVNGFRAMTSELQGVKRQVVELGAGQEELKRKVADRRGDEAWRQMLRGLACSLEAMAQQVGPDGAVSSSYMTNNTPQASNGQVTNAPHDGPSTTQAAQIYKMDREFEDVNGRLPVKDMLSIPEFKKNEAKKKHFSRRQQIYGVVVDLAKKKTIEEKEAARLVEDYRRAKGYSLHQLQKLVRQAFNNDEI